MVFPSPNHGERRGSNRPDLVVLHYTGMTDTVAARARLCDPAAEVSAHWLVHEDGQVEALVDERRRAWHAGAGSWQGRSDVNSHSIGIEIANPGDRPFPHGQMQAVERLLAAIMARWAIPACRVIAHSDFAPDRKIDPGPRLDWRRLALAGLALWQDDPQHGDGPALSASLDRIGYPDAAPADRLRAYRLRFAPWLRGPESPADRRIAAAVVRRLDAARAAAENPSMLIYKILRAAEWHALQADGRTAGAPVDVADGYVHFSTSEQVQATRDRHFAGESDLHLLACNAGALAAALKWEPARGGALFPHLYRELRLEDVVWHRPIGGGPIDLTDEQLQ